MHSEQIYGNMPAHNTGYSQWREMRDASLSFSGVAGWYLDRIALRTPPLAIPANVSGYITTDRAKQKVHIFADTKN